MTAAHPIGLRRGFTMVELIVGAVILTLIAGATASSLAQMVRAREGSAARRQAHARAGAAASLVARDMAECARDEELLFAKVLVAEGGAPGQERDGLLMLIRSMSRVRGIADEPEGMDFEVQYRVEDGPAGGTLWRRADPALDAAIDGGGVAVAVAGGVVAFSVEASDGKAWWPIWDSDSHGLPHGLRITVTATDDGGRVRAVSRRVVALDRVPLPPHEQEDDAGAAEGAS